MAGATPIYALPYPTGTDRVMDGDNAIQALAERTELVLNTPPSAWAVPALLNGWVPFGVAGYINPRYRKINGIVYVQGLAKSGATAPGTVIFNLPAGFRPSGKLQIVTCSNSIFALLEVAANGDYTAAVAVNANNLNLGFSFPAEA